MQLAVLDLLLAIVKLVGNVIRLSRAIAQRDIETDPGAIVRKVAPEQLSQNGAITAQEILVHIRGSAVDVGCSSVRQSDRNRQRIHLSGQSGVGRARERRELR